MNDRSSTSATRRAPRRFTSAHAMSAVSLFVALTMGGAWAAGIPKNSVRSKQIKDSAVIAKDVRDESLSGSDVADGSLTGQDVRDDSLTGADVDEASLALPQADPTPRGPAGGALAGEFPNPSLAQGAVGSEQIADGSLAAADLGPDSVGSPQVAANALRAEDLATASVDFLELASSSVGPSEVAQAAIGDDEVANESLGAAELASSSVAAPEIATGAVGSSEVLDGALNGDDVGRESGTITFDQGLIAPGNCTVRELDVGVPDDMRSDLIAISQTAAWPGPLTVQPRNSTFVGHIAVSVCNTSEVALDPLPSPLRWIAVDV